jgi:hypothetical protein
MKTVIAIMAMVVCFCCDATPMGATGTFSVTPSGSLLTYSFVLTSESGSNTGDLRFEVWAFAAPYEGVAANGYKLAQGEIGPLDAGHVITDSGEISLTTPAVAGTYYLAVIITEYDGSALDNGYQPNSWWNLTPSITYEPVTPPPPPASITPQIGLWWNPNESGSGYAIDYKHGTMVMTVYSYTAAGAPQWYLAFGPLSGDTWTGTLYKFTDGQCISCAYKPEVDDGSNDGTVTVVFSSVTSGTMYLPGGRVIPIEPQAF